MSNWKYTDDSNAVVVRTTDDGYSTSCLVEVITDWIAEGNTPDPADPVHTPVITVTPWQIRKALNATSLREAVEAAVLVADKTTKDAWQYATAFNRNDPLVSAMGVALGKTPTELDSLFELAITL